MSEKTVADGIVDSLEAIQARLAVLEKPDPDEDDDEADSEQEDDDLAEQHQDQHQDHPPAAQGHNHGDCELCDENFAKGRTNGMQAAVAHYEEIPGITELREEYDLSQATINIVP